MAKTAIITGVRRIGGEVARALLEEGYNLVVVYRTESTPVKALEKEGKGRVLGVRADLSLEESYQEVVDKTLGEFGRVDAFVHLASPYVKLPLQETGIEELEHHIRPIAYAFFVISKRLFDVMQRNEGRVKGRIVAFGDWAVERTPYRNYSAYFIAKGALHTAVRVLAKEFAPSVLVNCIALGPVLIPEGMDEGKWEEILRRTPLRRQVSLKDVVELTLLLLRTESMTGEIIHLDGGRHLAGSGV